MRDAVKLVEEISSLPPERIAEVEDFVAFLTQLERERALNQALTRAAGAASEAAFAAVWDNEDDAA